MYTADVIEKYTKEGHWQSTTLSDIWDRNAKEMPQKEAICDSRTRLTWAQAKQWIDRLAFGLIDLGIKRGAVVALQLPNTVELWLLRIACEKAGVINFPLGRYLRHAELESLLAYVEATAIVIPWQFGGVNYVDMVEQVRPRAPQLKHILVAGQPVPPGAISLDKIIQTPLKKKQTPDLLEKRKFKSHEISFLVHTSGSTGLPKVVENSAAASLCQSRYTVKLLKFTKDDIVAALSPAARGPNVPSFLYAPLAGAKIVMIERFDPEEALKLIERERVTVVGAVPTMLSQMVNHPNFKKYDIRSLRMIFSTGSLLPYAMGLEIETKMGVPVVQTYGAVDSGSGVQGALEDSRESRLNVVGKHTYGGEIKIIGDYGNEVPRGEVGEVWLRGPCSHAGYYKNPEATREVWTPDHWYKTGDLGQLDEQGYLKIVGRKRYAIKRGGVIIYPAEIEDKLITHPRVAAAAVVAMPDPVMVHKVCVYIVPKSKDRLTIDEIKAFLREKGQLEGKLPERVEFIDRLPTVSEGEKVDRKVLEKDIAEKLKKEGKLPG